MSSLRPEIHELLVSGDEILVTDLASRSCSSETTQSSSQTTSNFEDQDLARKHHGMAHVWTSWKWEILTYILVLATPLIMVATLYPHAGQPVPSWPFRITINSLLSVYSVALRASIGFLVASCIGQLQWAWFTTKRPMYDIVLYNKANRSAWGSLTLLWNHHVKQPLTALGCMILILSAVLDPFIQQLTRPMDCTVVSSGQARLPRTSYPKLPDIDQVVMDMRTVVDLGIAGTNVIGGDCATGNCTFSETYGTVGWCSYCEDSSADLSFESFCSQDDGEIISWNPGTPEDCPANETWDSQFGIISKLSLPSSPCNGELLYGMEPLQVTCSEYTGKQVAKIDIICNDETGRMTVQIIAGKTFTAENYLDITTVKPIPECNAANDTDNWRCGQYGAATCILTHCARVYNATVHNGLLSEHLISYSGLPKTNLEAPRGYPAPFALLDKDCLSSEEKVLVQKHGFNANSTERWVPSSIVNEVMAEVSWNQSYFEGLLDRQCLYFMGGNEATIDTTFLGENFRGSLNGTWITLVDDVWSPNEFEGDPVINALYNSGHIDMARINDVMANISESLTQYLRTHGEPNYSADALGQVNHYATCIEVQWYWITLPAVLAVLTLILLLLVITTANTQHKPVWKESPLVRIIRGVNGYKPGGKHLDLMGEPTLADLEKDLEADDHISDVEEHKRAVIVHWKFIFQHRP